MPSSKEKFCFARALDKYIYTHINVEFRLYIYIYLLKGRKQTKGSFSHGLCWMKTGGFWERGRVRARSGMMLERKRCQNPPVWVEKQQGKEHRILPVP